MTTRVAYAPEIVDRICSEIANGKSLRTICNMDGMPDKRKVFEWVSKYPDFKAKYDVAIRERAHAYVEEMMDIADNGTNDWMENNDPDNPGWKFNGEHVQRSKVRLEARKWVACKLLPKIYGEKVEHMIAHRQATEMTEEDLERIAAGGSAGTADQTQVPGQPSSVH